MAENLAKMPPKGILKSSSSFEKPDAPAKKKHKETKWDEMNIIATHHPPDKDYGHMKIEEPKTPYNWALAEGDEPDSLDPELLAERIRLGASELPKSLHKESVCEEEDEEEEEEEEEEETPEEKEKRKLFENKRKEHYNEYYAVKLARKLMSQDMEDEDDDDDDDDNNRQVEVVEGMEADSAKPSTSNAIDE